MPPSWGGRHMPCSPMAPSCSKIASTFGGSVTSPSCRVGSCRSMSAACGAISSAANWPTSWAISRQKSRASCQVAWAGSSPSRMATCSCSVSQSIP